MQGLCINNAQPAPFLDVPEVVQAIQNVVYHWKSTGCALITISPRIHLNPELEQFFTVVDLPLPDTEELHVIQKELVKPVNVKPNRAASRAAKGLTEFQAECSYALSIIQTGFVSTKVVTNSKAQMIRKSGLMEFWTPESIKNVGGLGNCFSSLLQIRAISVIFLSEKWGQCHIVLDIKFLSFYAARY